MQVIMKDRLHFNGLPETLAEKLYQSYRVANPAYNAIKKYSAHGVKYTKVPQYLYAGYKPQETAVILPRGIVLPEDGVFDELGSRDIVDLRHTVEPVEFPCSRIKLNPMQCQLEKAFRESIKEEVSPGYLIVAGTAFGKTIGLLNLASITKQPTLVLTHRTLIRDAWMADFQKMFGREHSVGLIQNQPRKWVISPFVTIAMEQTLHNHPDHWKELFSHFGCVIQDECHITPAPYIQNIISAIPALYRLGGTATPRRRDHLEKLVYWTFGDVWFSAQDSAQVSDNQLSIDSIKFVHTRFEYEGENEVFDIHEMMNKLCDDAPRNTLIVKNVLHDLRGGNSVLVVSTRVAHCEKLVELLTAAGANPLLFIGSRPQGHEQFQDDVQALQHRRRRLVVATEQMIREGTNIPALNRLHITVPIADKGNTIQLCGRISRSYSKPAIKAGFVMRKKYVKKNGRVTVYLDMKVPSLRRRVAFGMLQAFKELKIKSVDNFWFI